MKKCRYEQPVIYLTDLTAANVLSVSGDNEVGIAWTWGNSKGEII